jgi:CDP-diacylglycerol--glycerol-3-phosphate 3-phosphatidyltransferase
VGFIPKKGIGMSTKTTFKYPNLPNYLTVSRLIALPFYVAVAVLPGSVFPEPWSGFACALLFLLIVLTDAADGKIARKYGLVSDLGKFLDPLADKFAVITAMALLLFRTVAANGNTVFFRYFLWATLLVVFRELAITSVRLVASTKGGVVIAANSLGKIKTVLQDVCIIVAFVEPAFYPAGSLAASILPLTAAVTLAMSVMTVWSGAVYIAGAAKYLH